MVSQVVQPADGPSQAACLAGLGGDGSQLPYFGRPGPRSLEPRLMAT